MTVSKLTIPYPDFKLYETIDPEQFDLNNTETVNKINGLIDVLNQIMDGLASGESGADIIDIAEVAPFTSNKLQSFLREIVYRLENTADGSSGADLVGVTPIFTEFGSTVQGQLEGMKSFLDAVKVIADNNKVEVARHITSADHDERYYTKTQIDARKVGTTELTDRAVTDTKVALKNIKSEHLADQSVTASKLHPDVMDVASNAAMDSRMTAIEDEVLDKSTLVSQTLRHGTQVVEAVQSSPVDVEIQGRTLASLGNSQMENGKYYVLADKKTKVQVDGAWKAGVGKFQKSASLATTGDFAGKVSGSTSANPHVAKESGTQSALQPPSFAYFYELSPSDRYGWISNLSDGSTRITSGNANGNIAQQLFSFNVIEQVERTMGRIPKSTVAEKVQWVKDNVAVFIFNWYGFGSSPTGNKASIGMWDGTVSAWHATRPSHANSIVTNLKWQISSGAFIDANGFVHYLAYAEPSNGTTASVINTDYVSLDVELKTSAVLDTKPAVVRVANFEGKVGGSTVENPHVMKRTVTPVSTLLTPSQFTSEDTLYSDIAKLDGVLRTSGRAGSGHSEQHLFSFDLIAEIERNIGRIPRSALADKVQWVKDNVNMFNIRWYGFGSSPTGNKATINVWSGSAWTTYGGWSHTTGVVTGIGGGFLGAGVSGIDANGQLHFLAYAEPSNGTTASTINTDYVELEIELKQAANFHDPLIPLYEVDSVDYGKILVDWNESEVLTRYPRVQGVQHLQNPAVIVEGENLVSNNITDWTSGLTLENGYFSKTSNTGYDGYIEVPVIPNQEYTISIESYLKVTGLAANVSLMGFDSAGVSVSGSNKIIAQGITQAPTRFSITFTMPVGVVKTRIYSTAVTGQTVYFKDVMLTLGSVAKPFVPRNPSYLYAPVKLGQIGNVRDALYKSDGQWYVRKSVEKDVVLDGTLAWTLSGDRVGFKSVRTDGVALNKYSGYSGAQYIVSKYNGSKLDSTANDLKVDNAVVYDSTGNVLITIADTESGWGESYTPTADDIKRYFNGWKYVDGTTWNSVLGDGQTATASTALSTNPTGYTPYKLSYVLAAPQNVNVTDKVEGSIVVSGLTQVEVTSGLIVRERVVPQHDVAAKYYRVNHNTLNGGAGKLTNKASRLLRVYKSVSPDTWEFINDSTYYGGTGARLPESQFDPTAEYSVTYLVLDRHLFTNNATDVRTVYNTNLRSVVDKLIANQSDNALNIDKLEYGIDYVQAQAYNNTLDIADIRSNLRSDASKALVLETRTSDPTSPVIGQMWLRTDLT